MAGVKYYSYGSQVTLPDLIQHPLMGLVFPITWTGGLFNGQGDATIYISPEVPVNEFLSERDY
jgi:triacylglycerol lipase